MASPFYFGAVTVRIPVSATSAATPFNVWDFLPLQSDMAYMICNPNPFDIRIISTPRNEGGDEPSFIPVTSSTGLLLMSRTMMGPFTSSKPLYVSVQAYANPGQPLPESGDYTGCFVELFYGSGN